jgi:hypothetical protein
VTSREKRRGLPTLEGITNKWISVGGNLEFDGGLQCYRVVNPVSGANHEWKMQFRARFWGCSIRIKLSHTKRHPKIPKYQIQIRSQ